MENKNKKLNPELERTQGSHAGKGNEKAHGWHEKAAHHEQKPVRKDEPKHKSTHEEHDKKGSHKA